MKDSKISQSLELKATPQGDQVRPKIIVLDDDPTGSQTVHSCLLLLEWDVETLVLGLKDASPIFFILTNTRSLPPAAAAAVTAEVCNNLKQALAHTGITHFLVVSRSDSTLRGHYPLETDVIAQHLGPFDAHFLTPQFFEAGRVTLKSTHYIRTTTPEGTRQVPTHDTEFARDSVFGYSNSYLPKYVEEKTKGAIPATTVECITLTNIRQGILGRLMDLQNNCCVAVDGEQQGDFDQFTSDLLSAVAQGKKFLFRSAASLLTSLSNLPPQPISPTEMNRTTRSSLGVVVIGSHVEKTTQQLQRLLKAPGIIGIEIDVSQLQDLSQASHDKLLNTVLNQVKQAHSNQKTPAIYTSREEFIFADTHRRLIFGEAISTLLVDVVRELPQGVGFLISKGGITSNNMLSKALKLTSVRLLGQIIPGVSVVKMASEHPQFANLPVVMFPGNVGENDALLQVYQRLIMQRETLD